MTELMANVVERVKCLPFRSTVGPICLTNARLESRSKVCLWGRLRRLDASDAYLWSSRDSFSHILWMLFLFFSFTVFSIELMRKCENNSREEAIDEIWTKSVPKNVISIRRFGRLCGRIGGRHQTSDRLWQALTRFTHIFTSIYNKY